MQLKDVTQIIADILRERGSIPLTVDRERYLSDPRPFKEGNWLRGGLRKALRIIEQAPVIDAIPVTRCRDCVWCSPDYIRGHPDRLICGEESTWSSNKTKYVKPDEFCSRATPRKKNSSV